tara:strand:+ start:636 stop:1019 length:384 start_codon:yes stop_codon:yes gene_type:complete
MSNAMKTITMSEYRSLLSKSKAGWRCFYIIRDDFQDMCEYGRAIQATNSQLRTQIENGGDVDIAHLKAQFVEMYDKLKEYTDCVVCMETIQKDNIEVPRCGHIICKTCYETIKSQPQPKCPICRKTY